MGPVKPHANTNDSFFCIFTGLWVLNGSPHLVEVENRAKYRRSKTWLNLTSQNSWSWYQLFFAGSNLTKFHSFFKRIGACSIKHFSCNLRPFCRKLRNLYNLWANLWSKFGRNYKSIIYGSVKIYGIGPGPILRKNGSELALWLVMLQIMWLATLLIN